MNKIEKETPINTYYFLNVLMKHHLEETESDDLRKKMERKREKERELCGTKLQCLETPGKRLCVCFQLCVCARACLQHTDVPSGAQDEGGGEKEKMCCPGQCLSVYSSALVKRGHSMLFFKFFIKL